MTILMIFFAFSFNPLTKHTDKSAVRKMPLFVFMFGSSQNCMQSIRHFPFCNRFVVAESWLRLQGGSCGEGWQRRVLIYPYILSYFQLCQKSKVMVYSSTLIPVSATVVGFLNFNCFGYTYSQKNLCSFSYS